MIDLWDGQTYRRALTAGEKTAVIEVRQDGTQENPRLEVTAAGALTGDELKDLTATRVKEILGTQVDLTEFYRFAEKNQALESLIMPFRGVKPPRFPTLFEALLNSISCQQISLNVCVRMLNRIVENYGRIILREGQRMHAFPEPNDLAGILPEDLRKMGYSGNKARAIVELTELINSGRLDMDKIAKADDETAAGQLMALRGVGRWTAEYTLLRGNGRTHLFPTGDSGALGNLRRWLDSEGAPETREAKEILASWKPYAGLIYYHLLLRKLAELGYLR
jgi:DNA-3-methyladenine glycosylase II